MVRTEATGRLELTDQTACRTWLRKLSVPARSLRITKVTLRMAFSGEGPKILVPMEGQYTISGDFWSTPFSRTSSATPIPSRHGIHGNSRIRFPTAADGVPHNSRARLSETITTGLRL